MENWRIVIGHAVFDLDGALIDSAPLCAHIVNAMLADRGAGRRVSVDETRPHVTAGGRRMVEALLAGHCADPDQTIDEFRQRYAATPTPAGCLYPGVRRGLEALTDEGVGLAIWSNKPQRLCDKVVNELGLGSHFSAVVGTGPGVPQKPDCTGFDRALALAGGSRERSCYVGDTGIDHETAARAGVPFIMLTYGYGQYEMPWSGAFLADRFDAVPALVMTILAQAAG
ncbi:MAG TPA: HAD hydrolase-like protein [Caulobacteraceae bacterium]